MWVYLLSALLAYVLWKLVLMMRRYAAILNYSRHIPCHPDNHWFLGVIHLVDSADNYLKLCHRFLKEKNVKMFQTWVFFMYPANVLVHPDTIRPILMANSAVVPKNRGIEGGYRMAIPWIGEGLLVSNDRKWERNRRLLTPAFHFDILKPYVTVYHSVADLFLARIAQETQSGRSVDVYPLVSRATLDTMLRCALSYVDDKVQTDGEHHPYVSATRQLSYLLIKRNMDPKQYVDFIYHMTEDYRAFSKLCNYVHGFAEDIIKQRRAVLENDPGQLEKRRLDFLDILLTARDEEGVGLTDLEIRNEVDTFMFEGHDTTASSISWAIHSLAKYPENQGKILKELHDVTGGGDVTWEDLSKLRYLTCFIKETMRMYTVVPLIGRKAVEPITVDGIRFPAGTNFDIHLHLLHHNPHIWPDHEVFRPERFLQEESEILDPFMYTPFSAGPRNCIGQIFALNEIKVVLTRLLTRFKISLDPDREAIPYAEIVMRAQNGIYLHFQGR